MANLRESIMSAIETRLATITTANGYNTNVGNNVFLWRVDQMDPDDSTHVPGIIIRDRNAEVQPAAGGVLSHVLTVEIETVVLSDTTTDTTARSSAEDVLACVGTDQTWGGLADHSEVRTIEVDVGRVTKILGTARITLAVEYHTTSRWTM